MTEKYGWHYREVPCKLYCIDVPDDERWLGYAKMGDEWTEVLDETDIDQSSAKSKVERRVNMMLMAALKESDGDDKEGWRNPLDDLIDPDDIDPTPLPELEPLDPDPVPPRPTPEPPEPWRPSPWKSPICLGQDYYESDG